MLQGMHAREKVVYNLLLRPEAFDSYPLILYGMDLPVHLHLLLSWLNGPIGPYYSTIQVKAVLNPM